MKQKSWLPAYLALGLVWGCSFIFIKLGLEFLTPFGVACGRCALGALALVIYAKLKKIALPTDPVIWRKLWIVALLLNLIPGILFAYAEVHVTSILAGIINATTPFATLLVMLLAFREEKLKREQIFGLLLGGFGVLVVLGVWNGIGDNQLIGVIALLAAVTCYGISFPYTKKNIIDFNTSKYLCFITIILLNMPQISYFFGIKILMHYNDHNPPHFEAWYNDYRASIDIQTYGLMAGYLPPKVLSLVIE